MKVLVINAGSSSLKYQLLDTQTEAVLAKGLAERIGIEGSKVSYKPEGGEKITREMDLPTHAEAISVVLSLLTDPEVGAIRSMEEIDAVGHRVVHGGEKFADSALITPEVKAAIRECIPLAPLHNPANLTGIEACEKAIPHVPQVAVFDTAFHQTMPKQAYLYALPYELYEKYGVRRYGFHGTSHAYVSKRAAEFLGRPVEDLKIVTCHLGNGSSLAAVKGGRCVDTSMGMTPLAGVPMGTRSGDIDPAILKYLADQAGYTLDELDNLLNKQSGVDGVSGVGSDFRDLTDAMFSGHERATLAMEMFAYHVRQYIGAYATAMGGLDVIVFTAGVGENGDWERAKVCEGLEFLGVDFDAETNKGLRGREARISKPGSRVEVLVIPTNEELKIALETERLAH